MYTVYPQLALAIGPMGVLTSSLRVGDRDIFRFVAWRKCHRGCR